MGVGGGKGLTGAGEGLGRAEEGHAVWIAFDGRAA